MDTGFLVIRASNYFVMDFIGCFNHFIVSADKCFICDIESREPCVNLTITVFLNVAPLCLWRVGAGINHHCVMH